MKKYTFRAMSDNSIRIIYANSLKDAMTKLNDVALEKGDWFTFRKEGRSVYIRLYKVIDDRLMSTNGFSKAILCEKYLAEDKHFTGDYTIVKEGRETIQLDDYVKQNAVRFNSAEEALKWLKRQAILSSKK